MDIINQLMKTNDLEVRVVKPRPMLISIFQANKKTTLGNCRFAIDMTA